MKPVLPSVFLSPDAVQTQTAKLMGRQSAGRGFMRGLAAAYRDDDRSLVLVHGGGSQQAVLEIEARDTGWVRGIEHRRVQEPSTWPQGVSITRHLSIHGWGGSATAKGQRAWPSAG